MKRVVRRVVAVAGASALMLSVAAFPALAIGDGPTPAGECPDLENPMRVGILAAVRGGEFGRTKDKKGRDTPKDTPALQTTAPGRFVPFEDMHRDG